MKQFSNVAIMYMKDRKQVFLLGLIIVVASFLRFYNLMHDSPYFFNPDERNMAIAITQFKLPAQLDESLRCISSEFNRRIFNFQFSIFKQFPNIKPQKPDCNLNPHFFAYSQFPLYLSYVSDQTVHLISSISSNLHVVKTNLNTNEILITSFPAAIFWLRFWSAISSTLTVLFVYLITNKLIHNSDLIGNYAAFIAAFTPGLIQAAHFGTTESLLTMLFLASIYFSISLYEENTRKIKSAFAKDLKIIIWLGLSIGVAIGSKLTGIFFLIPPLLALIGSCHQLSLKSLSLLRKLIFQGALILVVTIIITILSSPYNLVAWTDFISAVFGYEKDVATGLYPAFYTSQFVDTTPVIFQAQRIFPYVLGWPVFIIGTFGFLLSIFQLTITFLCFVVSTISKLITQSSKSRSKLKSLRSKLSFALCTLRFALCRKSTIHKNNLMSQQLLILITSFLIYFLPNAFLYAKWTRFMTPIFPFFAIFSAFAVQQIYQVILNFRDKSQNSKFKTQNLAKNSKLLTFNLAFIFALLAFSSLPGIAFMSIYTYPDSRLQASYWIYNHLPDNSYVLSETANVVDIPLGIPDDNKFRKNYTVISFDFYHLDENPLIFERLLSDLERADYIFIPSRRLFANYTRLANKYPRLNRYYQLLFSGALGFTKVAEISSFPKLEIGNWKLEIVDELGEETYTVFDHPVVRIYKKTRPMTIYEYEYLMEN